MKSHKYNISVAHIEDKNGNPVTGKSISFLTSNHDEIIELVQKIQGSGLFENDDAASFAVGIKLFWEVMLKNKESELFSEFRPHFGEFMKKLKSSSKNASQFKPLRGAA